MKKLIFLIFIFLSFNFSLAHLDAGEDKIVDGYLIDFGYSPETPKSTDNIDFVFNLVNGTTKDPINPTSVWIRISDKDNIVFTGTFHPEFENVAFSYTFPREGDYEILARFNENSNVIAESNFNISILRGRKNLNNVLPLFLLAIIIILVFYIRKSKLS